MFVLVDEVKKGQEVEGINLLCCYRETTVVVSSDWKLKRRNITCPKCGSVISFKKYKNGKRTQTLVKNAKGEKV